MLTRVTHSASDVLLAMQRLVQAGGGRLCFLQSRQIPGASDDHDVDMAVDARAKQLLPQIFEQLRSDYGYRLVQAIQWDVPFSYYFVLVHAEDAKAGREPALSYLRPDISWDPQQSSANFICTDRLLDHCIDLNGFSHLQPDVEWAYQLFKRLRKGGATPEQLAHARALQQQGLDSLSEGHRMLEARLPRALVYELRTAVDDLDVDQIKRLAWLARPWLRLPRSLRVSIGQLRAQLQRAQSRLSQPPGLIVWLHDPDPVTARQRAEQLSRQLAPVFRGRCRIQPFGVGSPLPSRGRWRARLSRAELDVRTVHPNASAPPELASGWDVHVRADECAVTVVLQYLERRMHQQGWYAPHAQDS